MLSQQEKSRSTAWKIAGAAASVLAIGAMMSQRIGQAEVREFPAEPVPPLPEVTDFGLVAQSNWQSVLRVSATYGDSVGFGGLVAQTQENADTAYDNEDLYEIASLAGYILGESDPQNNAVDYGSRLYEAMAADEPAATVERFAGLMTDGVRLGPQDVVAKRAMITSEEDFVLRMTWFATIPAYYGSEGKLTKDQRNRLYEVCGLPTKVCHRVYTAFRYDAKLNTALAGVFEDTEAVDIADDDQLNEDANKAVIAYAKAKSFGVIAMEYMFIYVGVGSSDKMAERVGLAAKIAGKEGRYEYERGVTVDVLSALSGQPTDFFDDMYTKGQAFTDDETEAAVAALQDFNNIDTMPVFLLPLGGGRMSCDEHHRFSKYCERVVIDEYDNEDDAEAYCDSWRLAFNRARSVQRMYRFLFNFKVPPVVPEEF